MMLRWRPCGSSPTSAWAPSLVCAAARWPSNAIRGTSPRAACSTRCVGFHRRQPRPLHPDRIAFSLPTNRRRMLAFSRRPKPPRVLIVRQTDLYELPVRRQAEALTGAGYRVEVLIMRRPTRPRRVTVNGVSVTSLPASLPKHSKAAYVIGYAWFFTLATATLATRSLRRRYRVVQVNTMPDFLVFCAVFAKLTGSKVVAYMNEPSPELAETVYGSPRISRLMVRLEQAALRFADHAVTVTPQLRARYAERGADATRISVVLNGSDRSILLAGWTPSAAPPPSDRFTVICHGTIEDRYGQDTIVEAAALARDRIPNLEVVFTGRGSYVP